MLKSYIVSAFRSILANKLFSAIHIIGLSIGLAACFIMLMIVIHEHSYDKHNEKLDRIYKVFSYSNITGKYSYEVPSPLSDYIKEQIPEAENAARTFRIRVNVSHINDEEVFNEKSAYCIDRELFDILTIPVVSGNFKKAMEDPNSILISRKIAENYFAGKDPVGQYLHIKSRPKIDENTFVVAGVFEDFPHTSTFRTDYILPMKYGEKLILKMYSFRQDFSLDSWFRISRLELFVSLNSISTENKSERTILKYIDIDPDSKLDYEYRLQSYSNVHLNSKRSNLGRRYIDEAKIKLFTGIAILILLIACLNFIVMYTSRIKIKAKDVGIRKVIGAARSNVATNILTESVLYSLLSLPLTYGLIELFNKQVAGSLNVKLTEGYSSGYWLLMVFLILTIMVGLVSGLYSTIKLMKLTPLQTITYKKNTSAEKIKSTPALLIAQMVVFIMLIFCTIIVKEQTSYFKEIDLGFNPENILILSIDDFVESNYDSFKEELKKSPLINDLSGAMLVPPTISSAIWTVPKSDDPETMVSVNGISVDYDFIKTLQINIIEGRGFNKNSGTDSLEAFVLNKSAMKAINLQVGDILGSKRVIGVVKDFKYGSIREEVPPIAIDIGSPKYFYELAIRYVPESDYETVKWVKEVWNKFYPNHPVDYYFMDDKFDEVYKNDYNFAGLINTSAGLSIFLVCLGLFGFTVFSTQQRIKEIGIRRILGASVWDMLKLFFSQYVSLIVISSLIGVMLGNYFISQWLNEFAYKIDIELHYFLLTVVIAVSIILCTLSVYIVKTVASNPVDSLRYE